MSNFKTGFNQGIQQKYKLGEGQGFKDLFSGENLGKGLAGALPGITTAVGGLAGGLISDGFSTVGGQVLNGLGAAASAIPGVGMILGPALQLASGIVNRGFGTKWDDEGIAKAEAGIDSLNNFTSGATNYDALMGDINRMNQFNKNIKASDLGEDGWFVNRTQNKANELNKDMSNAYSFANRNISNTSDNIASSTLANLERNYAAFGGPLFAYGGHTHGANFTNGLMFINNGGTHESNPYEGVPISMDQEGNPNLVEEGEIIWNDYVFSDRLKVPKAVRTKYKLRGPKDMTFADAIEKLSKESEERPNDPISQRGLDKILPSFMLEQETLKMKKGETNKGNKFATGGRFGNAKDPFDKSINYTQTWKPAVENFTLEALNKYLRSLGQTELNEEEFNTFKNDAKNRTKGDNLDLAWNALNWIHEHPLRDFNENPVTFQEYANYAYKNNMAPQFTTDNFDATKLSQEALDWISDNPISEVNRHIIRVPKEDGSFDIIELDQSQSPWYGRSGITGYKTWEEAYPYLKATGDPVKGYNDTEGLDEYIQYYDINENNIDDFYKAFPSFMPEGYVANGEVVPEEEKKEDLLNPKDTWMRYAPVAGYGVMALTDALGLTNKADYTNADAVINAANNISSNTIKFTPIGDFMSYNPFDTEYHANQLRSVAGATRRNIMNTSGGNRATAMAGILASDNNTINQMGDLYRKAAEYNLEQKQKVADFNRATNMFNTEGMFKADAANQSNRVAGLDALLKGYAMREQAKLMSDQAKAANISGLIEGIGDIGRENVAWNMIKYRTDKGVDGPGTETYSDDITGYGNRRAQRVARGE